MLATAADPHGWTTFMAAVKGNQPGAVDVLMAHGAEDYECNAWRSATTKSCGQASFVARTIFRARWTRRSKSCDASTPPTIRCRPCPWRDLHGRPRSLPCFRGQVRCRRAELAPHRLAGIRESHAACGLCPGMGPPPPLAQVCTFLPWDALTPVPRPGLVIGIYIGRCPGRETLE